MGFLEKYPKYFEIEWKAQTLQKNFKIEGPSIKILIAPSSNIEKQTKLSNGFHYLIIQGSFDPPPIPHLTLISKSIEIKESVLIGAPLGPPEYAATSEPIELTTTLKPIS